MEFDIWTIVCVAVALLIGFGICYLYNRYNKEAVNKVYTTLKTMMNLYGPTLEKENPELYAEVVSAMATMEQAMSDEKISLEEAFDIAQKMLPLIKRLEKFVKEKYEA
jgi:uncharacterized protein YjgD (DUF1641 family)